MEGFDFEVNLSKLGQGGGVEYEQPFWILGHRDMCKKLIVVYDFFFFFFIMSLVVYGICLLWSLG